MAGKPELVDSVVEAQNVLGPEDPATLSDDPSGARREGLVVHTFDEKLLVQVRLDSLAVVAFVTVGAKSLGQHGQRGRDVTDQLAAGTIVDIVESWTEIHVEDLLV